MAQKTWQRVFSTLLLVGMVLSWVAPLPAAAAPSQPVVKPAAPLTSEEALAKIESLVLTELDAAGQTDFFVWMSEKADLSPAAALKTKEAKGQFVFDTLRATAERTQKDVRASLASQGVEFKPFYIANKVLVVGGNRQLALDLAMRADVAKITANHQYQLQEPFINPDAPSLPNAVEPNIAFVKADQVWALGVTGAGTVMAGNDTGLQWDHPAIINKYRGWNGSVADHNYNWWDATGTYPSVPGDGHGHGTHTTGTMVGDDGAGNQIGMAPGAQTVHCKNMTDGGSGDDTTFTTCFQWDLAPWDLSGANPLPSMAPDAINNSWGYWGGNNPVFEDEIAALQAAGILVEVSAGNEGSSCSTLRSPSDYEQVLTTGSIQHAGGVMPGTITGFSSRGPSSLYPGDYFPDVMAPGENIRSSVPGGGFQGGWSGTSMSGPHVTALVGLIWSANPALIGQVAQTVQIIKDTAVPLTGQTGICGGDYTVGPNNDWGFGTIDALAAVQLAIAMGGAGQLDGTVTDASTGLPVANVNVTALHEDGFSWTVATDASGYYTATVAAGTFTVSTAHPGYQPASLSGVDVVTDTVTTVDFVLTPRGVLEGYVTDFDNGFGIEALVQADDGTFTYSDPSTGYYMMNLDPGTYDVTASADNYAPSTATVDIFTGVTTSQDFALQAAVAFSPAPLQATLTLGDAGVTVAGLITNRQPWAYDFEFREQAGGFNPVNVLAGEDVLVVAYDSYSGSTPAVEAALTANGITYLEVSEATFLGMTVGDLLAYQAVFFVGIPYNSQSLLMAYLDAGGSLFVADNDVGYSLYGTVFYTNYLQANYMIDDGGSYLYGADFMSGLTLDVMSDPYPDGFTVSAEGTEIFTFDTGYAGGVAVNRNGYKAVYLSFDFVYLYDTVAAADVVGRAFAFLGGGGANVVPWLGEVPGAGTVPAVDTLAVTAYFTATEAVGVNQPGQYTANLRMSGTPNLDIPVVMTVEPPPTWGKLEGTVTALGYCDLNWSLLAEAEVTIQGAGGYTATVLTDANGYFQWWLDQANGPLDVTVTAPGYETGLATGVVIVAPGSTWVDFYLRWLQPCASVTPNGLETTLDFGQTDTQPISIFNAGAANLNFQMAERDKGYAPNLVSLPPFTGVIPADTAPASIGRAPNAGQASAEEINAFLAQALAGEPAFAVDVYPGYNLVYIPDTTLPGAWNVVAALPGNQYFGGDFLNGDFSKLYTVDYALNQLHTVDTTTGAVTVIGSSAPNGGESWTGLTGSADGTLYGSATTCSNSTLYEINPSNGAVTQIGAITNGACIIDIAINADGQMYGVEIINDNLIAIDPATGAGTVVGSLGVNANYAQGMDFEEVTGILYWAAYTSSGELRVIDTSTGNSTLIGAFPGGAEVDAFAFPTGGGGDVPWLSESPITGTIPASMLELSLGYVRQPVSGQPSAKGELSAVSPAPVTLAQPEAPINPDAVLWDQPLSAVNWGAYVNQEFGDFADYSTYLADDFVNGSTWSINSIYVPGSFWNGGYTFDLATALNWAIYADDGSGMPDGYPGVGNPPVWSLSLAPSDPGIVYSYGVGGYLSNSMVLLPTPVVLPPGHYWLYYYPTMDFGSGGQFGLHPSDTTNDNVVKVINPGGGFGFGTTMVDWTVLGMTQTDFAFRLYGASQSQTVDVTFDSNMVGQPGVYTADLIVKSDDPVNGSIAIPVTMTINAPANWGQLEGTVTGLGYCDINPAPLEEAEVYIVGAGGTMTWTLLTDASGYYSYWFDEAYSPMTMTVTYPDHSVGVAVVTVTGGGVTLQDFDLYWLAPCVSANPLSFEATLAMGERYTTTLDLTNDGAGVANFELSDKQTNYTPGLAGEGPQITPRQKLAGFDPNARTTKGILEAGGTPATNLLGAGDVLAQWPTGLALPWGTGFGFEDETVWFSNPGIAGGDDNNHEYAVDGTATGRTVPAVFGGDWAGDMAYNSNTGMFWQVNVGGDNCLYEWDPASGATGVSVCGPWTTSERGVAYDSATDTFYVGGWNDATVFHIDSGGGLIEQWPVGLSISGLAFNPEAGLLFILENSATDTVSVFDVAAGAVIDSFTIPGFGNYSGAGLEIDCDGNLWAANQATGDAYLVDSGVPADLCGGDALWLEEFPMTGTIDPYAVTSPEIVFDAGKVAQPGQYTADLKVATNDPFNGKVTIPVTLTISAPADYGQLQGVANSLGYCDVNPALLADATVSIESNTGITWTLETDGAGAYLIWLPEGGSPFTVYAAADDHQESALFQVSIIAGQTTFQDFDLRWLAPCVSVDPTAFNVEVGLGYSLTQVWTLNNGGALGTDFAVSEAPGAVLGEGTTVVIPATAALPPAGSAVAAGAGYQARGELSITVPAAPTAGPDILIACADDMACEPLVSQLLAYGFVGSITTYDPRIATPTLDELLPFDVVLTWANYTYADAVGMGNVLADYVDAGGKVIDLMFALDPSWGLQGRFMVEDYTALKGTGLLYMTACLGAYDPGHPIMDGITAACDVYRTGGTSLTPGSSDVADWDDGEIFVAAKDDRTVVTINAYVGTYFQYTGQVDAVVNNAIKWLAVPSDVPWLYEEPITGTIGADSFFDVWVTFDAMTYTVGTELSATLKVDTADPVNGTYEIPVFMTIVAPEYGVSISPDATLTGEPGETVVYDVIVTNSGNGPVDSYDLTLGASNWTTTLDVTTVGPLAAGESATAQVSVTVPPDVVLPDDDAVQVTATSQGDDILTAMATLTTVAGGNFGVDLEPEASAQSSEAGKVITYTLRLTNTGTTADTFEVSVAGAAAAWASLPVSSFDLAGGEGVDVLVIVTIPADAAVGDYAITVTATSFHDPTQTDTVDVTTTVFVVVEPGYTLYLPVVFKLFP